MLSFVLGAVNPLCCLGADKLINQLVRLGAHWDCSFCPIRYLCLFLKLKAYHQNSYQEPAPLLLTLLS